MPNAGEIRYNAMRRWGMVDGCLGKARGVRKREHLMNASASTVRIGRRWASRKVSWTKRTADRSPSS